MYPISIVPSIQEAKTISHLCQCNYLLRTFIIINSICRTSDNELRHLKYPCRVCICTSRGTLLLCPRTEFAVERNLRARIEEIPCLPRAYSNHSFRRYTGKCEYEMILSVSFECFERKIYQCVTAQMICLAATSRDL